MAFEAILEIIPNNIAKITLIGELDGSVAQEFKEKVEEAANQKAQRLVLMMEELAYMSSAGLRVLVFAKQKMGSAVDIYMVGVQETVMEPIKMTGLDRSVILLEEYDAAQIENL